MNIKTEFKKIGIFYVMTILYWISIGLMAGYWTLYYNETGFSLSEISLILLMYPISAFLFEIPTGVLADMFGNKISVFLSYLFTGFTFLGIVFSGNNIVLVCIFYFLAGISFTLETGALEAWFVEYMKNEDIEKFSDRLFGRWGSIGQIGFIIGTFISGAVSAVNVRYNFILSAIFMLLLSIIVLIWGKNYTKKSTIDSGKEDEKIHSLIKEGFEKGRTGFKEIFNNRNLRFLLIGIIVLSFANAIVYNSYQPYVVELGLSESFLGYSLTVAGLISFILLNFNEKIVKLFGGNRKILFISTIILGVNIYLLSSISNDVIIFIILILYTLSSEFCREYSPAYRSIFNKNSKDEIRATMISSGSFLIKVADLIGIGVLGLLSRMIAVKYLIGTAGITIVLGAFFYLFIQKRKIK
ncbi:MFS transporter [Candidatus Dojkabacteria bacterium]|nr:MFS transporter [Candidatus Dojkabacteria bacterium]